MHYVLCTMNFVQHDKPVDLHLSNKQHGFSKMEVKLAVFMERPNGDGWAHLLSDRHGVAGRTELQVFLRQIGVRRPLHRVLTYAEHCDIRDGEIQQAIQAGALVISRRQLARLLREKREAETGISPRSPAGKT